MRTWKSPVSTIRPDPNTLRSVHSDYIIQDIFVIELYKFRQYCHCHVKIPKNDPLNEVHNFNFYLSNVGRDNPQGSFDCIQQTFSSSGASQLNCLGFIQDKITVCATNDSYQMTRERMTQAEEESRNRSTKVIKPGGPYVGLYRYLSPSC
uniref:RNA polymerase II elongation factor ELL2-like n=1 Tax=Castor canadensis TaxID=51338 RepID=A0A8B7UAG9_CASCN|nr:RNA polymerase II elongation factor ELL2-like [Castor canadensis]